MSILVVAEHENSKIKAATLNTIAAGVAIGGDIHILVAGQNCAAAGEAASKISSVAKVLVADSAEYVNGIAENLTPLVLSLADDYEHILANSTSFGKNLMPRVAAMLDVQQISEISGVTSTDTFDRPTYAGNAIATIQTSDAKKVITVRGTAFDPVASEGGSASIENISAQGDVGLTSYISSEISKNERPELTSARVIISGGRGMQSGDNFPMLEKVADLLNAAVGASRAAVDAGFVPNDYQVGQTGKIVAPELYIAVGISGAIQHLAGMKDSKVIVAINKDEEAPIFQVADYGLVADLFQAVPELEETLKDQA
jgi:electron transfer flavoprotein alpha subunit